MRAVLLLTIVTLAIGTGPVEAQRNPSRSNARSPQPQSAAPAPGASAPDTAPSQSTASRDASTPESRDASTPDLRLPVSLEHIREMLARPASGFTFDFNVPSTFRTSVREQQRLEAPTRSFQDLSGGPAPAGGLYGYEAQRVMHNPTNEPLMQPYAAFSGGELLTVSIEALAERYLGGRAVSAVSASERARAEAAAREEVLRAIAEYCAAQPDKGLDQPICRNQTEAARP